MSEFAVISYSFLIATFVIVVICFSFEDDNHQMQLFLNTSIAGDIAEQEVDLLQAYK